MRKTSYFLAFLAVVVTLVFNVFSILRPDWLVVSYPETLGSKLTVEYGLMRSCELHVVRLPVGNGSQIAYTDYKCRPFPARVKDACEDENQLFCIEWTTAGYLAQLAAGFAALSSLAIVFGVTTHSRRRRIWGVVATLIGLQAACLIGTFAIVTDTYNKATLPSFERARPGLAYVLGTVGWVLAVLATFGVLVAGSAASRGQRWAAGNRAYQPIEG